MRVLVNAISAEKGGALSNLQEAYTEALQNPQNEWIFITGKAIIEPTDRITVLRFPTAKKSWFHRFWFDTFKYRSLLAQYIPNEIYNYDVFQRSKKITAKYYYFATNVLYYTNIKFKFSESKALWTRQNILCHFAFHSIRSADIVVVESKWMKPLIAEKVGISPNRIIVKEHKTTLEIVTRDTFIYTSEYFFYPTSPLVYKNTQIIIDAALLLAQKGKKPVFVITLCGDENNHIKYLKMRCESEKLNVLWIGRLNKQQMQRAYSKCTLIFPSYLETVGLPLIEAKSFQRNIICADLDYAHCTLEDYSNALYFDYQDADALAHKIQMDAAINEQVDCRRIKRYIVEGEI